MVRLLLAAVSIHGIQSNGSLFYHNNAANSSSFKTKIVMIMIIIL